MSAKAAFLFPGQGAQYPGMGKDFYDQFAVAKATFEEADRLLGWSLSTLIFEGPLEELTLTKHSQLAIYVTSSAILRAVESEFPHLKPHFCAGLSLGEYTALTAAGVLSFADCLQLVRVRAEAMHRACEEVKGSMQVVLGLSEEAVASVVNQLNPPHPIWVANLNCPGQVVIAGSLEALALAEGPLKAAKAKRILPLDVSGAFHSGLMKSAQEALRAKIGATPFTEGLARVVMNVTGDVPLSLDQMRSLLIDQVVSCVRWERGIRNLEATDVDFYIEMGPGKTLSGMNKRIGSAKPIYSIEKVADLEIAREALCNC
jgi:[acyl-carrier-protein] S-malonyltransferase